MRHPQYVFRQQIEAPNLAQQANEMQNRFARRRSGIEINGIESESDKGERRAVTRWPGQGDRRRNSTKSVQKMTYSQKM